jgi:hypothetical protein
MILLPKKNLNIATNIYLKNYIQNILEKYLKDEKSIEKNLNDFFKDQQQKKQQINLSETFDYDKEKLFIEKFEHEYIHPEILINFLLRKMLKFKNNNSVLEKIISEILKNTNLDNNTMKEIINVFQNPESIDEKINDIKLPYVENRNKIINEQESKTTYNNYKSAINAQTANHYEEIQYANDMKDILNKPKISGGNNFSVVDVCKNFLEFFM